MTYGAKIGSDILRCTTNVVGISQNGASPRTQGIAQRIIVRIVAPLPPRSWRTQSRIESGRTRPWQYAMYWRPVGRRLPVSLLMRDSCDRGADVAPGRSLRVADVDRYLQMLAITDLPHRFAPALTTYVRPQASGVRKPQVANRAARRGMALSLGTGGSGWRLPSFARSHLGTDNRERLGAAPRRRPARVAGPQHR